MRVPVACLIALIAAGALAHAQQPVVNVGRRTETGEASRRQGATTENIGNIRGRSHAARGNASAVECSRTFTTGCQARQLPDDEERPAFEVWLAEFRQEALESGLSPAVVEQALDGLEPLAVVVERDRSQAETVLTVEQYLERRLTRGLVRTAQEMAARYRTLLAGVSRRYDVQSRYLVAVWGLESNFGRFSGVRPTIQALATLAWDGRRGSLFRGELMDALEILDRGDIEPDAMKGSWAGAMGQPQFMPSSYLEYAQDFDGDGRRDIWASHADVFASVANYLQAHGWRSDETWGREVRLPESGDALAETVGLRETGCRAVREMTRPIPLAEWQRLGVRNAAGRALPRVERDASLVRAGSRAFLVYTNYEALLEYNCAHAYALSVGLLSDRIGG